MNQPSPNESLPMVFDDDIRDGEYMYEFLRAECESVLMEHKMKQLKYTMDLLDEE